MVTIGAPAGLQLVGRTARRTHPGPEFSKGLIGPVNAVVDIEDRNAVAKDV